MEIFDGIKHTKMAVMATKHHICRECRIVDSDISRIMVGSPCPNCGKPSPGGMMFFDMSVIMLIELIQEAYFSIPTDVNKNFPSNSVRAHSTSLLIFFCTLKELLLERHIAYLMEAQQISELVRKRLIADNNSHSSRLTKLFPALTSTTWENAIATLDSESSTAFASVNNFLKKATDIRNDFIHEGKYFSIDRTLAFESIHTLFPMLDLFIALHNKFVHPFYANKTQPSPN